LNISFGVDNFSNFDILVYFFKFLFHFVFVDVIIFFVFDRVDFDKDGSITQKDFEGMGERFAVELPADKAAELKATFTEVWGKYQSVMVRQGDSISKDAFMAGMLTLANEPGKRTARLQSTLPLLFHAVDANGDGKIDEGEFAKFFTLMKIDPAAAPATFKAIDDNGDGEISLEEFIECGTEFFLSQDESKSSKIFWGPLVD